MPTSVALGSHFERFIQNQLESGRYNNASEVVRAGLRLLEDQQTQVKFRHEELRAAIAIGLASGHGKAAETVFKRLDAKYRKLAGRKAA